VAIATPRFEDSPTRGGAVGKTPEFEISKVQGDGGVKLARAPFCNCNVRCGCGSIAAVAILPAGPSAR